MARLAFYSQILPTCFLSRLSNPGLHAVGTLDVLIWIAECLTLPSRGVLQRAPQWLERHRGCRTGLFVICGAVKQSMVGMYR